MLSTSVADPGFPVGGGRVELVRGTLTPEAVTFRKFVCQNERIWTLGGGHAPGTPPRSANEHNYKFDKGELNIQSTFLVNSLLHCQQSPPPHSLGCIESDLVNNNQ